MGVPISEFTLAQSYCPKATAGSCLKACSGPERVTIAVDADCLRRLLHSRQLCAEHFSCQDCHAKNCVRRMLLQNLTR